MACVIPTPIEKRADSLPFPSGAGGTQYRGLSCRHSLLPGEVQQHHQGHAGAEFCQSTTSFRGWPPIRFPHLIVNATGISSTRSSPDVPHCRTLSLPPRPDSNPFLSLSSPPSLPLLPVHCHCIPMCPQSRTLNLHANPHQTCSADGPFTLLIAACWHFRLPHRS